jgi:hypothetical protein
MSQLLMLNPYFLYRNILSLVTQHSKENMDVKMLESLFITRMFWYDIWIYTMGQSHAPVNCDTCVKTFLGSDYLRLYVIQHQGVKPLKCDVFTTDPTYVNIRDHWWKTGHLSVLSAQILKLSDDMRKHLTIHMKEKAL